jgi:hypothetical protein
MPAPWTELTNDQSHHLWKNTPDLIVLDVRSPPEYTGP